MTSDPSSNSQPQIIAETERWLVLNKPAGWLTIAPSAISAKQHTKPLPILAEWARTRGKVWIVHRLDRDTTGVVLFAKNAESHREASIAFQERENRKQYECIARGLPAAPVFKLSEPIEGAPSTSQIEVRERFPLAGEAAKGCFLARVRPTTGRRHQIRIHLAKAGYPICGDTLYEGPRRLGIGADQLEFPRMALHASSLELPTGEKFEAPWPEDFLAWMTKLREVKTGGAH